MESVPLDISCLVLVKKPLSWLNEISHGLVSQKKIKINKKIKNKNKKREKWYVYNISTTFL